MSLTPKEVYIIEAIVSNEYSGYNYHLPDAFTTTYEDIKMYGDSCWTDTIEDNGAKHGIPVRGKEISGVLSSLNKKGYVVSCHGKEGTALVTKAGWEAYVAYAKTFPKAAWDYWKNQL